MCIILTCEKYVRPDYDLLETCFWNNPDGAGIMWTEDDAVQIVKGFDDVVDLAEAIKCVPDDSRLVVHMRIATSGGIDVGTCHPFPVCDSLEFLHASDVECDVGIAHNGVIAGMPTDAKKGISDTVYFVGHIVNDLYSGEGITKSVLRRIKRAAPGNRFAVMTSDGTVHRLGNGWETVTKGIQASNGSWRYDRYLYSYGTKSNGRYSYTYDWDDWDDDYAGDYWGHKDDGDDLLAYSGDDDFEAVFDMCCGDCISRDHCMTYGPWCPNVSELVEHVIASYDSPESFKVDDLYRLEAAV